MTQKTYNAIWAGIFFVSLIGVFLLVKTAYANPLGLPEYAFVKPEIKEAYAFAKTQAEKLDGLPCNCGCMSDAASHGGRLHSRGLIDCFMQGDVNKGGGWERHASECGLCYEDALYAQELYEEGGKKGDVAAALQAKYSKQIVSTRTVYGGNELR